MSQGSLNQKIRFLGQKMCSVPGYRHTDRHTDTHESDYVGQSVYLYISHKIVISFDM